MLHHFLLRGSHRILPLVLGRDRIGLAQILLDHAEHFFFDHGRLRHRKFARLLGRLFSEVDDGLDDRLEMPVTEHHGAEHDLFGQFLRFQLNHQHRILRAGDDEIELALFHLVDGRVEHVFAVAEADARGADRAHERRAGQRQRGGGRHHGDDVGIVLLIVREHGDDDLGVAAPALGEQRPDRAVDQPRRQRVLFRRAALALEITAGNAAGRVVFFGVVDGQRQKVDAGLRLLGGDDGGDDGCLTVGGDDGAVGLTRDFSSF